MLLLDSIERDEAGLVATVRTLVVLVPPPYLNSY